MKRSKPPKVENSEGETAVRLEDKTDKQTDALFSCPEEGCVRVSKELFITVPFGL